MRRSEYFNSPLTRMTYKMVKGTETSSKEVKYLPFYALDNYSSYSNNIYIGVEDKTTIFGLPKTEDIFVTRRSFTDLVEFLKGDYQMAKFTSKDVTVYGGKGILLDDTGKILFIIVTDSRYWKKSEYDKMFLSSAFYQPQYKTVYKKVFDNIIYPALQEGVRMEVMSSKEIKDIVYKSLTPTINDFQSIDEYNEQIRAALEKAFLQEEEILFPVIRDRDETFRMIDEITDYEYGKLVTEACLSKMLDEIWELYQKPDNAFIASHGIVTDYILEHVERLEWRESEIIEEDEDEMEIEPQPPGSGLNECLDGTLPLARPAQIRRLFTDPAGVAPTDTQVLRGVISSSDEEAPF